MAIKGGYAGTILRVDLTRLAVKKEPLEETFARKYLGGRGFTSRLQYDLIPPAIQPLGSDNVALIAPGALTGTDAPSSGRFTLGARSPLTGLLGDANSGGFWGAVVKKAGYDLLIIQGQAPHPVYLWINNDRVELRDARHLWGKDMRQATELIKAEVGKGISVAGIGPAGENLVHFAALIADGEHAAGRTGLGAVLGSKRLKAIAVRGVKPVPLHDPVQFKELTAKLVELLRTDKRSGQELKEYGTTALLDHHTALGMVNTRNYQTGLFEGKEKIDGDALNRQYLVRPTACYRCPCQCDRYSRVDDGEFAGTEVGGPEYSTVVAFGTGCGNDNLASILKANELCNIYGLDTIETGNIIAYAMELYQRGIITRPEVDGVDLSWGNYHAILEMIDRITFRQGFGDLLANGIVAASQEIGRNAERYAVHVKGMTPPPPDARALKVYNFRYAVSPRGADHLRISAPGAYGLDSMPIAEAAAKLKFWENIVTVPDMMGLCKFPYSYYAETVELTIAKVLETIPALYTAATSLEITGDELMLATERLNNLERAHNARLGMTAKNDTLPPRFTQDPMPEGPAKGKVHDILEPLKQAWYQNHGWDIQTGLPLPEKLMALGLPDVAHDLQQRHIISNEDDKQ
ncbi:MAG: aldehyde ferredoxin oxidoreductase family protein [Chloroflexota bacterium]